MPDRGDWANSKAVSGVGTYCDGSHCVCWIRRRLTVDLSGTQRGDILRLWLSGVLSGLFKYGSNREKLRAVRSSNSACFYLKVRGNSRAWSVGGAGGSALERAVPRDPGPGNHHAVVYSGPSAPSSCYSYILALELKTRLDGRSNSTNNRNCLEIRSLKCGGPIQVVTTTPGQYPSLPYLMYLEASGELFAATKVLGHIS